MPPALPADPPAKRRRGPKPSPLIAERNRKLIAYFLAGHHLSAAARHFGISPSNAHQILKLARDVP